MKDIPQTYDEWRMRIIGAKNEKELNKLHAEYSKDLSVVSDKHQIALDLAFEQKYVELEKSNPAY